MPNRDRRSGVKLPPEDQRVQLAFRLKRGLYNRLQAISKAKGYLSVAEWARSVILAASEK